VRGLLRQLCNDIFLSVAVARAGSSAAAIIVIVASLSFFSRLMTDGARGVVVVVSAEDDGTGRIIYHYCCSGRSAAAPSADRPGGAGILPTPRAMLRPRAMAIYYYKKIISHYRTRVFNIMYRLFIIHLHHSDVLGFIIYRLRIGVGI